jgi:hypothetical protein
MKLGPTFSNLNLDVEDPNATRGTRFGIGGGGFVMLPLTPRFALQFEGLFTPKGTEFTGTAGTEFAGLDGQLALDYLEFPVLMRINGPRGHRAFHGFVGPSLAYNLSARNEFITQGPLFDSGVSDDVRDQVSYFEMGLVFGAGVEIGPYFIADARYSWGLTNVNDLDDDDTVIKNRALTIIAGIRFSAPGVASTSGPHSALAVGGWRPFAP